METENNKEKTDNKETNQQNDNDSFSSKKSENVGSDKKDTNHFMGILAYLGPLVIIPYLTQKDDQFVKFHIKQGLVLLSIQVVVWILAKMFFMIFFGLMQIINLGILILVIIGIANVVNKKEKLLPLVGHFSKYFKF